MKKSINEWQKQVHENAKAHGWWDKEREFTNLLFLVISECVEAGEEERNGRAITETYYTKDKQGNDKMEGAPSELADIVIRVLDLCEHYGIDLEKVMEEKHKYNMERPYKHGGKKY